MSALQYPLSVTIAAFARYGCIFEYNTSFSEKRYFPLLGRHSDTVPYASSRPVRDSIASGPKHAKCPSALISGFRSCALIVTRSPNGTRGHPFGFAAGSPNISTNNAGMICRAFSWASRRSWRSPTVAAELASAYRRVLNEANHAQFVLYRALNGP